jgi:hypothetical protein
MAIGYAKGKQIKALISQCNEIRKLRPHKLPHKSYIFLFSQLTFKAQKVQKLPTQFCNPRSKQDGILYIVTFFLLLNK